MHSYDDILKRLGERREQAPGLAELIDLHHALIAAESRIKVPEFFIDLDEATARTSMLHGEPLLEPDQAGIDWSEFERLFENICRLSAEHRPDLAQEFESIQELAGDCDHLRSLATEYMVGGYTASLDSDNNLVDFVLNHALRPFLRARATALLPRVDDSLWFRGYCPVCGGEPDLASFEPETGSRHLLCSRCDAEWTFKRLACPFCGNEDASQLAHYPGEDERYRLDVCEICRRYVKTVDRRSAWLRLPLPVERVLTVAMDLAALERGYHGANIEVEE